MRRALETGLILGVLALFLVAAGCGGSDEQASGGGDTSETTNGCEVVDAPEPRDSGNLDPPENELDPSALYTLEFETNCGNFTLTLDPDLAPSTTASLVALAEAGYFDDTIFHRIVPGFLIQGGDPSQTGSGGPGYTTIDPPPNDASYERGIVAMAKAGDEPPGASGSQFFVVTAEAVALPPEYAIVGTVEGESLEVVGRIGRLGDETELPTQTVRVEKVTVTESS